MVEYCSPAGVFTVLLSCRYTSVNCDQRLLRGFFVPGLIVRSSLHHSDFLLLFVKPIQPCKEHIFGNQCPVRKSDGRV